MVFGGGKNVDEDAFMRAHFHGGESFHRGDQQEIVEFVATRESHEQSVRADASGGQRATRMPLLRSLHRVCAAVKRGGTNFVPIPAMEADSIYLLAEQM